MPIVRLQDFETFDGPIKRTGPAPNRDGFVSSVKRSGASMIGGLGELYADATQDPEHENAFTRFDDRVQANNPSEINSLQDIADSPWLATRVAAGNAVGFLGPGLVGKGLGLAGQGLKMARVARAGEAINSFGAQTALAGLPSLRSIGQDQRASGEESNDLLKYAAAGTVGAVENLFGVQKLLGIGQLGKGVAKDVERAAVGEFGKTPWRTAGKTFLKTAAGEGGEELLQSPIEQFGGYKDPTSAQSLEETAFGGVMGAIGGGVFGLGGGAFRGARHAGMRGQMRQDQFIAPDAGTPTDLLQGMARQEQYNQVQGDWQAQKDFDRPAPQPQPDPETAAFLEERQQAAKLDADKQTLRDELTSKGIDPGKIEGIVSAAFPTAKVRATGSYTAEQQAIYDALPDTLTDKQKRGIVGKPGTAVVKAPKVGKTEAKVMKEFDDYIAAGLITPNEESTLRGYWDASEKKQGDAWKLRANIGALIKAKQGATNGINGQSVLPGGPQAVQAQNAGGAQATGGGVETAQAVSGTKAEEVAVPATEPPVKPAKAEDLPAYKAAVTPWLMSAMAPEEVQALEVMEGVDKESKGDEEVARETFRTSERKINASYETIRKRYNIAMAKLEAAAAKAGFDLDTAKQILGMQSNADVLDQAPVSIAQAAQAGLNVQRGVRGQPAVTNTIGAEGAGELDTGLDTDEQSVGFGDAAVFDEGFAPKKAAANETGDVVGPAEVELDPSARDHTGAPLRPVDLEDAALEWKENIDGNDIPPQLLVQFTKLWIANQDGALKDKPYYETIKALRKQAQGLRDVPQASGGVAEEQRAEDSGPESVPAVAPREVAPAAPAQPVAAPEVKVKRKAAKPLPSADAPPKAVKAKRTSKAKAAPAVKEEPSVEADWNVVSEALGLPTFKGLPQHQRTLLETARGAKELTAARDDVIEQWLGGGAINGTTVTSGVDVSTEAENLNTNIVENLDTAAHTFKVGDSVRVGNALGVVIGAQGDYIQFRPNSADNPKAYQRVQAKLATFVSRPDTTSTSSKSEKFGTRTGELKMNKANTIQLLGANMYGAALGEVTVKEALQNSFDAVKGYLFTKFGGKSTSEVGHLHITADSKARTLEFKDDGIGMTSGIVDDAFFTIAGSNKGDLPPELSSGGLGMAKMGILMGAERIQLVTVRDGVRTSLDTSPKEIAEGTFKITTAPAAKSEHGTTLTLTIPKSFINPRTGDAVNIAFPSSAEYVGALNRPLLGPIEVKYTQKSLHGEPVTTTLPIGANFDKSPYQKVKTVQTDWATLEVYFGVKREDYSHHTILSSGVYQFEHEFRTGWDKLPFNIIVDVKPKVKAQDTDYPFENSRERFKPRVSKDIEALNAYLSAIARGEAAKDLKEGFKNIVSMPRAEVGADLAETSKKLKKAFDKRNSGGAEESTELSRLPDEVTIKDGTVTDLNGRKIARTAEQERQDEKLLDKSFKADEDAPSLDEFMASMKENPSLPIFHNNTSADYVKIGSKYGDPQRFFAELGTLMVEMKEILAKSKMYKYEGLDAKELFFAGISIDRGYGGVHIKVPFKAILLNPFYDWGATTLFGARENLYEAMTHEIAHQGDMSHGVGHNVEMIKVRQYLADVGMRDYFYDALLDILMRHESAFTAMREAYGQSTTENTGKSLDSFRENAAAASTGSGANAAQNALRSVQAGGGRGGGGNLQTTAGRGNESQGRGRTGGVSLNRDGSTDLTTGDNVVHKDGREGTVVTARYRGGLPSMDSITVKFSDGTTEVVTPDKLTKVSGVKFSKGTPAEGPIVNVNEKTGMVEILLNGEVTYEQQFAKPALLANFKGDTLDRMVAERSREVVNSDAFKKRFRLTHAVWIETQPLNDHELRMVAINKAASGYEFGNIMANMVMANSDGGTIDNIRDSLNSSTRRYDAEAAGASDTSTRGRSQEQIAEDIIAAGRQRYRNGEPIGVNNEFSKGAPAKGSTVAELTTLLKGYFHAPAFFDRRVEVVQSSKDLPAAVRNDPEFDDTVKAVVHAGKAYIVADKVPANEALSILLHEVGVHLGMKKLLGGNYNYMRLIDQLKKWESTPGSQQHDLVKRARERVKAAGTSALDQDHELVAYFVEEAVNAGINPTDLAKSKGPVAEWIASLMKTVMAVLRSMGMNNLDKLTAQDIVDLAYGAAHVQLSSHVQAHAMPSTKGNNLFSKGNAATIPEAVNFTNDTVAGMLNRAKVTAGDLASKALNASVFMHDLIKIAEKAGLTAAKGFNDLMGEKDQIRNRGEERIDAIMSRASKLTDQPAVEKFLRDSTINQKWGYGPKADAEYARMFKQLSPEGQAVVKEVFQVGEDNYKEMQRLAALEVNREYNDLIERFPKKQAELEKERMKELARVVRVMPKLEGPYAPLKRFGDHVVVARSQEYMDAEKNNDQKSMDALVNKPGSANYLVEFYDTAGAADARKKQLEPHFDSVVASNRQENFHKVDGLPWSGIEKIKSAVEDSKDTKYKEAMNRLLTGLYLKMLAESSARKSEIKRRGVLGSGDMFRAFAAHGRSNAHFIASMAKSKEINRQITAMRTESHNAPGEQRNTATRAYNEIAARYAQGLDYKETPWVDKALRASSFWMLLTSPAYYLQNATQTYMVSMPVLGGKYGGRAFTEINKAYGDVLKHVKDMGAELDLNKLPVTPAERAMLLSLRDKGKLDITIASDLGRWASGAADQGVVGRVVDKMYGAAGKVEALNRITTALAAYRLSNGSEQYAGEIVDQTQGNYAGNNAPRFFHANGAAKLMTQFRKYQLIQISLMGRLMHDSFKGASAEEKAVARRALMWLFAQQAVLTGIKGLPIPAVLYMVAAILGGDDDDDWERNLRKAIGDEQLATLLIRGVPAWMGLDASGRVGMGNAFSVLPFSDINFSKKGYKEAVFGASGAFIGGMGGQLFDGLDKMGKGDYYKGLEALSPRGLRDAMAGFRMGTEGVTSGRGDTLLAPDEITAFDAAMKAVGLPTTRITEFQTSRGDLYELGTHFKGRETELKNDYANAAKQHDSAAMVDAREEWVAVQESKKRWLASMADRGLGNKDLTKDLQPHPLGALLKAPAAQMKRERPWQEVGAQQQAR